MKVIPLFCVLFCRPYFAFYNLTIGVVEGDVSLAMKSALNLDVIGVMIVGGTPGLFIGGSYIIFDQLGYIDSIINYVDPSEQYQRSNMGM